MRRRLQISKLDEVVYGNVIMVCVTLCKIREACVKKLQMLVKSSLHGQHAKDVEHLSTTSQRHLLKNNARHQNLEQSKIWNI
jgi:hypothetical protein